MQMNAWGIVIREKALDDDRILTILTKEYGVLTAYARGAKKLRGRLLSSTELFCCSRFVLFKNKDRYTVDQAESDTSFFGIRQDIEKLALASYFAQLAIHLAPAEEPAEEQLRLLLNCLFFLEKGKRSQIFLKPLFELRMLTLAGYMPDLVACRCCGAYESERPMRFLVRSGELICGDCPVEGDTGPLIPLEPGVLAAMRHIIYSEPGKLFSFSLPEEGLRRLAQVTEQYLRYQLDTALPTLDFYHSLFPHQEGVSPSH